MQKIIRTLLLAIFLFISTLSIAQPDSIANDIEITIKDFPNRRALLCYYYGTQTFLLDSAVVDTLVGYMHFKSRKKLPVGMYFIATTDARLLDFIIADEKNIGIKTSYKNLYDSAIVESKENKVFFEYMQMTNKATVQVENIKSITEMLKRATKDKTVFAEQENKIRQVYKNLDSTSRALINTYPNLFVTRLLKGHQPIEIPSDIKPLTSDNRYNPMYSYYYRQHFWDNFDFSDVRYLHAPFYTTKIDEYLQNTIPKQPDSLNNYLDFLLARTKVTPEYYRYTLRYITQMCDDNLKGTLSENMFVHLVDAYHHDTISGTDKYVLERLEYKANSFRPNLIGLKAPSFSLPDSTGMKRSFEEFNSDYTLLIFFSAQCTHCQEQIPKFRDILQFTDTTKIKTMSVCTDGIRETWLPFLQKNKSDWVNVLDTKTNSDIQKQYAAFNLPVVYLLDKQKKIIAKHFTVEVLKKMLEQIHGR